MHTDRESEDPPESRREIPAWLLAFGPFLVIGVLILIALAAYVQFDFDWITVDGTGSALLVLTFIGIIAGVLPVMVGMLWFPYFRRLDATWIHAVLAFSAGLLTFIAVEMAGEAVTHAGDTDSPLVAGGIAVLAAALTIGAMELFSRWRTRTTSRIGVAGGTGLTVAYLVAIGLGLHSIGEGLAIGVAFVEGDAALVVLLTIAFITHNVTEGPAVIAAVAREHATPPLRHFGALGILAGGGVIVGGWIGSLAFSALVATVFFAIACGAILQVTWEMFELVRGDAGQVFHQRIIAAFIAGIFVLFFLEEIVVETWFGV